MSRRTPHLYRRESGTYYIRLILPKAIQDKHGVANRDIRLSLKTARKDEAKLMAGYIRYLFFSLIDKHLASGLTGNYPDLSKLISMQLKDRIHRYHFRDKLVMSEEMLEPSNNVERSPEERSEAPESSVKAARFTTDAMPTLIPTNEITVNVDGHPVTINHPGNPQLELEQAKELLSHFGGNNGNNQNPPHYSVRQVFAAYIDNRVLTGTKANAQTKSEHIQMLRVVEELLGPETNYYTLTFDDIEQLRNKILKLKDGRAKDAENAKTLSTSRSKRIFDKFKPLSNYAYQKEFNPRDIANGLDIEFNRPKRANAEKIFSSSDLQKLFSGYPYTQTKLKQARDLFDFHFWLIPILLYTGARLNEICQLEIGDVKLEERKPKKDGTPRKPIPYLHITEEYDENGKKIKQVKNEESLRKVPLHKMLIKLGFMDFVEKRRLEGALTDQLFDGLYFSEKNKWAKKASDWFNGKGHQDVNAYRKVCDIEYADRKNLHTFRHTFIDKMRDTKRINDTLISGIVGHDPKTTTSKYGKKQIALTRLKPEIDRLKYDIDISHLNFEDFLSYKATKGKKA